MSWGLHKTFLCERSGSDRALENSRQLFELGHHGQANKGSHRSYAKDFEVSGLQDPAFREGACRKCMSSCTVTVSTFVFVKSVTYLWKDFPSQR